MVLSQEESLRTFSPGMKRRHIPGLCLLVALGVWELICRVASFWQIHLSPGDTGIQASEPGTKLAPVSQCVCVCGVVGVGRGEETRFSLSRLGGRSAAHLFLKVPRPYRGSLCTLPTVVANP